MNELKQLSRSLASNLRYKEEPTQLEDEIEQMYYTIADCANVPLSEIFSKSRLMDAVIARHICFVFLKDIYNMAFAEIGRMFGMHHTSVMHGYYAHDMRYKTDALYQKIYNECKLWVC